MGGEKMSNDLENFDFLELGQAIQKAREKQRITREELAEELLAGGNPPRWYR